MNENQEVMRDERTVAVENASSRWGMNFLIFALLLDVAYRGLFRKEAAWDLLWIVWTGGGISTFYQMRHRAFWNRGVKLLVITVVAFCIVVGLVLMLTVAFHGR